MLKYYHIPVKNSKPSDRSKFDKARWSYPSVSLWRKQKLRLTKEISSKTNAVVWAKSPLQDDLTTLSFDIILTRFNKMKEYVRIYLMQNHSTCFGCPSHLPPGVYKTVTAASGKGHSIWAKTFLQLGQIWPLWRKVVAVPEAAFTVLCTPDGGYVGHPKHVESDFAVNKYLHTLASCWILLILSYDVRNHEYKIGYIDVPYFMTNIV